MQRAKQEDCFRELKKFDFWFRISYEVSTSHFSAVDDVLTIKKFNMFTDLAEKEGVDILQKKLNIFYRPPDCAIWRIFSMNSPKNTLQFSPCQLDEKATISDPNQTCEKTFFKTVPIEFSVPQNNHFMSFSWNLSKFYIRRRRRSIYDDHEGTTTSDKCCITSTW